MTVLERNWRCRAGRDRHRGAGRRRASSSARSRPAVRLAFGTPLEAVTPAQGGAAAAAGRSAGSPSTAVRSAEVRIDVVGVLLPAPRRRPRSSTCGGWPDGARARPRRGAASGVEGQVVEVQADLDARACRRSPWSGCPTRPWARRATGSGRRWSNAGCAWPHAADHGRTCRPAALPKARHRLRPGGRRRGAGRRRRRRPGARVADVVHVGELGLDGRVRPVRGVLPAVLAAAAPGSAAWSCPRRNAAEAALVPGVDVLGGAPPAPSSSRRSSGGRGGRERPAGVDDAGRRDGRRADEQGRSPARPAPTSSASPRPGAPLEVAAAGGHHLLLPGRPGAGKTMLAERLPGLLPRPRRGRGLEVTAVHSVAGMLAAGGRLVRAAAVRGPAPHRDRAALVGGGSGLARPGAVSLAHRGVLFLDEAPEFAAAALDALRQPLEPGRWSIAPGRRRGAVPGAVPAGAGGQPLPVRPGARARRGLHVHARCGPAALPGAALRPAARPGRPAGRGAAGHPRRAGEPTGGPETTAVVGGAGGARRGAAQRRRLTGSRVVSQRRGPGPVAARAAGARPVGARRDLDRALDAACSPSAATTGCCASRGRRPTSTVWAVPEPGPRRPAPCSCAAGSGVAALNQLPDVVRPGRRSDGAGSHGAA